MSLDVEGNGATCVECGMFDFLPTVCPWCHGIFCRDHAYKHHVPGPAARPEHGEGRTQTSAQEVLTHQQLRDSPGAPWCTPQYGQQPLAAASSSGEHTPPTASSTAPRCCACDSLLCVLTPCPSCGRNFCAAHRFHEHAPGVQGGVTGRDADQSRRHQRTGRAPGESADGERQTNSDAQSYLRDATSPYVAAHPLVLAPPEYRSRMMELTAILACWDIEAMQRAIAGDPAPSSPCTAGDRTWQFAVCSLSVAVEASVGQLVQRCIAALSLTPPTEVNASEELCRRSCPFKVHAHRCAETNPTTQSTRRTQGCALTLSPVPLGDVTKSVLQPGEVLVLRVGPDASAERSAQLEEVLSETLLRRDIAARPVNSHEHAFLRDARVRAAVTRWTLYASAPTSRTDSVQANDEPINSAATAAAPEPTAPMASSAVPPSTAAHADSAAWPFHTPPPLTTMPFSNTKASPLGVREASAAGAGGGRVVVAVLVQDTPLLAHALPAFVLALGKGWPAGRMVQRVKEEAFERLSNAQDRQRATTPSDAAAPASPPSASQCPFPDYGVFVLWTAGGAELAPTPMDEWREPLRDGDCLFLGTPRACAAPSVLCSELARLRGLQGKERAAAQLARMKKCTVM